MRSKPTPNNKRVRSLEEIGLYEDDDCAIDLWYRIHQNRKCS